LSGGTTGPIQVAVAKELFPMAIAGTAKGCVNIFPFLGGAFFQILVGLWHAGKITLFYGSFRFFMIHIQSDDISVPGLPRR